MSAGAPVTAIAGGGGDLGGYSGTISNDSSMGGWREVHVVFCGQAQIAWLRLLRTGFRHCFVVFGCRRGWVTLDPLSCWTDIRFQPVPGDFDLPGWYRSQGMITVSVAPARSARPTPAPAGPFTCVEAVKRVLGIRDRFVLTPYQLYRRLGGDPATAVSGRATTGRPMSEHRLGPAAF